MTVQAKGLTPHHFKLQVGKICEVLRAIVKFSNDSGDFERAAKAKEALNKLQGLQGSDKLFGVGFMLEFAVDIIEIQEGELLD